MIVRLLVFLSGGIWRLKARCNSAHFWPMRKFYILLYSAHQFSYGASIGHNSHFSGVPCLPHGMHGIFVSGDAKVGNNCVIFQHVTIGSNALIDSKRMGAPIIGDNCYIGAGAKIVGKVIIGDNVRIAANCVVYEDVVANSLVVSGRQEIIERQELMNNHLYSYHSGWYFFRNGRLVAESDPVIIERLVDTFKK